MAFRQQSSLLPSGYTTPPFPSLYWPLPVRGPQAYYLYHPTDIWRFTTCWTLLFYAAVHLAVAGWAVVTGLHQRRRRRRRRRRSSSSGGSSGPGGVRHSKRGALAFGLGVPAVYLLMAGVEGVIAGGVVGGLVGGIYQAGYFRMSTWIPFVWAFVNTLVLILSSFAMQGAL